MPASPARIGSIRCGMSLGSGAVGIDEDQISWRSSNERRSASPALPGIGTTRAHRRRNLPCDRLNVHRPRESVPRGRAAS